MNVPESKRPPRHGVAFALPPIDGGLQLLGGAVREVRVYQCLVGQVRLFRKALEIVHRGLIQTDGHRCLGRLDIGIPRALGKIVFVTHGSFSCRRLWLPYWLPFALRLYVFVRHLPCSSGTPPTF